MAAKKKATPRPPADSAGRACVVADCTRTPVRQGLCAGHYDTHRGLRRREG